MLFTRLLLFARLLLFLPAGVEVLRLCFPHLLSLEKSFLFRVLQVLLQILVSVFAADHLPMIFELVVLVQPMKGMLFIFRQFLQNFHPEQSFPEAAMLLFQ